MIKYDDLRKSVIQTDRLKTSQTMFRQTVINRHTDKQTTTVHRQLFCSERQTANQSDKATNRHKQAGRQTDVSRQYIN